MKKLTLAVLAAASLTAGVVATSQEADAAPSPVNATVTRVVDGDTVIVRVNGHLKRIRLIGIDAPELSSCRAHVAKLVLAKIVLGKRVRLVAGARDNRDRYGRLLRYVDRVSDGADAGRRMIQKGHAIARYDSRDGYGRHRRQDSYIRADRHSPAYHCPAPPPPPQPPPPPPGNCSSAYPACASHRRPRTWIAETSRSAGSPFFRQIRTTSTPTTTESAARVDSGINSRGSIARIGSGRRRFGGHGDPADLDGDAWFGEHHSFRLGARAAHVNQSTRGM